MVAQVDGPCPLCWEKLLQPSLQMFAAVLPSLEWLLWTILYRGIGSVLVTMNQNEQPVSIYYRNSDPPFFLHPLTLQIPSHAQLFLYSFTTEDSMGCLDVDLVCTTLIYHQLAASRKNWQPLIVSPHSIKQRWISFLAAHAYLVLKR